MMLLDATDPRLRLPARPIHGFDRAAGALGLTLLRFLERNPTAMAIAAPQVGETVRMFAVRGGLVAINPTWDPHPAAEEVEVVEGCLSLPGRTFVTRRWNRVTLHARDIANRPMKLDCIGILAQAVQHECEHLDGILLDEVAIKEL